MLRLPMCLFGLHGVPDSKNEKQNSLSLENN